MVTAFKVTIHLDDLQILQHSVIQHFGSKFGNHTLRVKCHVCSQLFASKNSCLPVITIYF